MDKQKGQDMKNFRTRKTAWVRTPDSEPVFVIDPEESILTAYVAWRAGTIIGLPHAAPSRQGWEPITGLLKRPTSTGSGFLLNPAPDQDPGF